MRDWLVLAELTRHDASAPGRVMALRLTAMPASGLVAALIGLRHMAKGRQENRT